MAPITLRNDINPWERQAPVETDLMYSRFVVYRDLGPECDRMRQSLEVLNSTGDKLTYTTLKECSSSYRWAPRAAAFDRFAAQADRARMVKRRRRAIDDQIKASDKLRAKALQALEKLNVDDLSPTDIVRFIDLAHKIQASVFAEFNEGAVPTTEAAGPANIKDIAAWSPTERRKRLESIGRELSQRTLRAVDDDEVVA